MWLMSSSSVYLLVSELEDQEKHKNLSFYLFCHDEKMLRKNCTEKVKPMDVVVRDITYFHV